MLDRLRSIFIDLTQKWECELSEFNGEADHLHMRLSLNPKVAPSIFVNNLKTVSSRLIRRDLGIELAKVYRKKPVFWRRSYSIVTRGGAPLSVIKQYIEQQESPH